MKKYKLQIQLEEPLTLGRRPAVSNEIRSLDYIPGTGLRGALYELMCSRGLDGKLAAAWFGLDGPRWSCAWPAFGSCNGDWPMVVPMPKSFLTEKRDFDLRYGIWNTLAGPPPEDPLPEDPLEDSEKRVWVRLKKRWLKLDGGRPACPFKGFDTEIDMHVGLHYGRQSNRTSALFSREAIAPAPCFAAFVADKEDKIHWAELADDQGKIPLVLGKRRSVNGGATLEWREANSFWERGNMSSDGKAGEAVIQLMTDTIIPGPNGGYLEGLDEKTFGRLAGVPQGDNKDEKTFGRLAGVPQGDNKLELKAASSFREVAGWSGPWGLPREQALAIQAGSVWRIQWKKDGEGDAVVEWLNKIEEEGLGLRRHEGFGWVAVNPRWLTETLKQETFCKRDSPTPNPDEEIGSPAWQWPGFTSDDRETLRNYARQALEDSASKKLDAKHVPLVHDLIAICQRTRCVNNTVTFLEERAERVNPRGWLDLRDAIKDHLRPLSNKAALFYLEALKVELASKQKGTQG